ncbi:MAG: FGGY family carbohydrate kinase [Spirochaetaceae bacterium]|nr:FGGY family carbohydrate kinase [Spirochaetaceae bacterium]
MGKYVVGIDVGTTGSKAMVFDLKGNVIGKGYREYKLNEPKPNWVEVGAQFLLDITFEAVKEAVANSKVSNNEIDSISFSVNRSSFCLVDEKLKAIDDKFYIWLDSRAESVMSEMNSKISPAKRNQITGMPGFNIFAAAKYYWVKQNEPETYKKTKYFSTVASYVMYGFGADKFAVEISDGTVSGLMDVRTLGWNKELADALGFDMAKFPPLCKPAEVVGNIKADIAAKTGLAVGTKIVAGSGDQQLAAMGAGVIRDGAVSLTIGTFGLLAIGLAKPDFAALEGLMIPCSPVLGVFGVEGPQVSGATCYRWLRDTLCQEDVAEANKKGVDPYELMSEKYISKSAPGSNGVVFYSALFGSGYPTWDTNATGMFLGLRNTHTKADMVRSVMEGITLEARRILEGVLASGVKMDNIITVTGGASKSPEWCQIIADIMNRKIRTLDVADSAVLGAAGMAAIGGGLLKNVDEVVSNMVRFGKVYDPIPANVEVYNKVSGIYKAAYNGLKGADVFAKLAEIRPKV